MSEWLEPGAPIPFLDLTDSEGNAIKPAMWAGKALVIYFYPKDDTPGCTKQACAFRDASAELERLGAIVIGISGDSTASHAKFRDKYSLNFPLLSDPGHTVSTAFGAYREKNMYGKKVLGIQRSTFLVDSSGVINKVWKRVQVEGHDQQVIAAVRGLVS